MDKQPTPAARGRKRSEESRGAVLRAAFELMAEAGYGALTIEGIARRAGVGKQTIYRWWPSKAHVLREALAVKAEMVIDHSDHGDYEADLRAFLGDTFRLGGRADLAAILRALMAEAQIDAEFGEIFRGDFLSRRRAALCAVLDRARERGDLPGTPTPELVQDIVFGTLWYRLLATHRPLDAALVDDLVVTLTGAPPPPPGAPATTAHPTHPTEATAEDPT
ncbi:TetR/AcrR family transcriptional regulator [Streptomyces sp. NPDC050560]|uniref:TetR/AcrR family transcriptional regulator n=1 Tax=Streptomyces sp. NPDC050560 TaxID=3365630 RepID=UPI0037A3629B